MMENLYRVMKDIYASLTQLCEGRKTAHNMGITENAGWTEAGRLHQFY